jgi:hypothetical protein
MLRAGSPAGLRRQPAPTQMLLLLLVRDGFLLRGDTGFSFFRSIASGPAEPRAP